MGDPEKAEAGLEQVVDLIQAELKAQQEKRAGAAKNERSRLSGAPEKAGAEFKEGPKEKPKAKAKTIDETLEEIMAGAGVKRRKEEPKADADATEEPRDADEAEALKAEVSPSISDIGTEETKRRRIIRWKKLNEINRKCAVIRSFGGKCVIMTVGRSRDGSKIAYDFQSREAFDQWKANDFIPSLEKEKKTDTVGPRWWRHPKRRQYDGVVFKPRGSSVVITPDGQRLFNTYLGWGVEPEPGDWSLLRRHIREVLASGDPKADDYIIRFHAWAYQHPDSKADVANGLDR
jgi:hypothetical protein